MANAIVYLKNEPQHNEGFKKQRGFRRPEPTDDEPKTIYSLRKDQLRQSSIQFTTDQNLRARQRSLDVPRTIDFIIIHFFAFFNLDLQRKFLEKYGLNIIEYSNYNKSVLFEITNQRLFEVFLNHVRQAYESQDTESYEGKPYNLIALTMILNF